MENRDNITFTDSETAIARKDQFVEITIDVPKALKSWQQSLYSFEWMHQDGRIKDLADLPAAEQTKRQAVEKALSNGQTITKPVLGLGAIDNIEIGTGRAEFLTLAAHGLNAMPVHIPKSNEKDFQDFIAALS